MTPNLPEQTLQLHDIHLPAAAGWWPPAPGWWLLAIITIFLSVWSSRRLWHWHTLRSWRKTLQTQFLSQLPDAAESDDREFAIQLQTQLKRLAMTLYANEHPAALYGSQWHNFLQQHGLEQCLDGIRLIEEIAHAALTQSLPLQQRQQLLNCCRQWARQQINQSHPESNHAI